MKAIHAVFLVMLIALLGACSVEEDVNIANQEDEDLDFSNELPNQLAIQDPYTRSFLVSTNETEDGFYEMRTWTDAYSMYIPVDGKLDETFYQKRKDYCEQFWYSWNEEEANISYSIRGRYENQPRSEKDGLFLMSDLLEYDGDYERIEDKNHIYHHAKMMYEVGGEDGEDVEERTAVYSYLTLVKDKKSDKALSLTYQHNCTDFTNSCNLDSKETEEHFWKLVKSVTFDE